MLYFTITKLNYLKKNDNLKFIIFNLFFIIKHQKIIFNSFSRLNQIYKKIILIEEIIIFRITYDKHKQGRLTCNLKGL
jgi:hypothetical protein